MQFNVMYWDVIREQSLGVLYSISSKCLGENMTLSWREMEDAYLKIPKHFLFDKCTHLRYQSFLYNGYIYIYIFFPIKEMLGYIHHRLCIKKARTRARKERPRERGSIRWLQDGSTETRSVGSLCISQEKYWEHNVDTAVSWKAAVSLSATSNCSLFQLKKWHSKSRAIYFSQYTSLFAQLAFVPFLWPQVAMCTTACLKSSCVTCVRHDSTRGMYLQHETKVWCNMSPVFLKIRNRAGPLRKAWGKTEWNKRTTCR